MQLRVIFMPDSKEKPLEKIIEELVDDTICKVLIKHPGVSYSREISKDRQT